MPLRVRASLNSLPLLCLSKGQNLSLPNGTKSQNPENVCKSVAQRREERGRSAEMFSFANLKCYKPEK